MFDMLVVDVLGKLVDFVVVIEVVGVMLVDFDFDLVFIGEVVLLLSEVFIGD